MYKESFTHHGAEEGLHEIEGHLKAPIGVDNMNGGGPHWHGSLYQKHHGELIIIPKAKEPTTTYHQKSNQLLNH